VKLGTVDKVLGQPTKQPGVRWAISIDNRLDALVRAANDAGASTTRQELVAALVLVTPREPVRLRDAVLRLRTATVHDTTRESVPYHEVTSGPSRRKRPSIK